MSETTKRTESPKVKTHPIMEIVAKSMFGLNNCDCVYYQKMVNRCAKKVLEYHNTHLHQVVEKEVIRGKIEELNDIEYNPLNCILNLEKLVKRIAKLEEELDKLNKE